MSSRAGRTTRTEPTMEERAGPEPELIVIARPEVGLRATSEGLAEAATDVTELTTVLGKANATIRPLFGVSEDRIRYEVSTAPMLPGAVLPDLSKYYRVEAPGEDLEALAERLRQLETVEAAYVKPPAELPEDLNDMLPRAEAPPTHTPDFTGRQAYLGPVPAGIDAQHAWTVPGGEGAGVGIIDIEGAWRFSHEDLLANQGGVAGGTQSTSLQWRNHGTAVVGEFGGDRNAFGVTGICPQANVRAVSIFGTNQGSAAAIRQAANALNAGDIILIELHRAGPAATGVGQQGYIAIEWWPDDFDAILYAIGRGVIVVEAAGNGAQNLDAAIYNTPGAGFPAGWTNPFNRANRDSGAILVGAGAPPPGTHGRDHGPDRSRLDFSNWGTSVDAQGWGREVTTSGYGDLQGGVNEDEWYTDQFSGTSSASPIVVGALGCLQGVLRARGTTPVTPARARQLLRSTGSGQQDAPGRPATQRIGNRPDLRRLIAAATKTLIKEKQEKLERKELKVEKIEKIERKELKREKLENKELKREKIERKEFKERKPEVEIKGLREIDVERGRPGGPALEGDLEERVTRIEEAVEQLTHFITIELRPNLAEGALSGEADLELSRQLDKEAADAKQAKDAKDVEKLREY